MAYTFLLAAALLSPGPVPSAKDYPIQPVPFTQVHLTDKFWAPRIETNRKVTIPYAFKQCEDTGRVANFVNAADTLKGGSPVGKPIPGYPFDDTDVYKVIEGAAYALSVTPDPKLDSYVDGLIAKIASAQEPDGYLYTARTINPAHPHEWSGSTRWVNEEEQSHELYNSGHLFEAATAHFWATGKRNLLNIAIKNADLLTRTFGEGKKQIWPGHEIVEMGLAKMYRATGKQEYLKLAEFVLKCRGGKAGGEYWQADKPVLEQTEGVGHAVRAVYLYSGMADVAALGGDKRFASSIQTIWSNVVEKKLYITGGIGAQGSGEAFGPNYYLPNASAYAETCAAIGNDYWNQRLFLLNGDAQYVDVFERTLYNGLASGVSLDGKSFFYQNPLSSNGRYARSAWFGCACCPGNITRFIASVPGYVYAVRGAELFVNLYVQNHATISMPQGGKVEIEQRSDYPWSGTVQLSVKSATKSFKSLRLRIPGWARNEASPGGLYRFADNSAAQVKVLVNNKPQKVTLNQGYAVINRTWKKGDVVTLDLPMPIRRVVADQKVEDDRGLVALQRGPIVFCAEGKDIDGGHVGHIAVPKNVNFTSEYLPSKLGGIVQIKANALGVFKQKDGSLEAKKIALTCIPYATWANRGLAEMEVWLPSSAETAHPLSLFTPPYAKAKITSSKGSDPHAINDQHDIKRSSQQGNFFHWWPKKGSTEWVEMDFGSAQMLSESQLYWFDDTGLGECRAPQSWKLLYKDPFGKWLPVETEGEFGVALDKFNTVKFKPVSTSALRIEVKLQEAWSAGIQQWVAK